MSDKVWYKQSSHRENENVAWKEEEPRVVTNPIGHDGSRGKVPELVRRRK